MNTLLTNISSLRISLKLSLFVTHPADWSEHKIKSTYTIWNIYQGKIRIKTDGKIYYVEKGDVVIFYPGQQYTAKNEEGECSFVFHQFSLETGNQMDLLQNCNFSGIIRDTTLHGKGLSFCKTFCDNSVIFSCNHFSFYCVFLQYLNQLLQIDDTHIEHFGLESFTKNTLINQIIHYMQEHDTSDIPVKEMAAYFHLSEKYFITYFKQYTGTTPKKYLIMLRMQKAQELLLHTDMKHKEIAQELGYADPYSFSKAFEHYYGMYPKDFCRI